MMNNFFQHYLVNRVIIFSHEQMIILEVVIHLYQHQLPVILFDKLICFNNFSFKEMKSNETMKILNENGLSLIKPSNSQIEKDYSFGKIILQFNNLLMNLFFRYQQK